MTRALCLYQISFSLVSSLLLASMLVEVLALRRGRRPVKNQYFTNEFCNCLDLFSTPMALQTRSSKGEIFNDSVQFQTEKRNISRRRSRTSDYADIANVTFLICRGKQRNVQRFLSHVYSYCFSVTLSLPSSSWFA